MTDSKPDSYTGASIEVLKGLEPVRRRPGMYTDTANPNHLGMEVIDNSVDEAVAGFCTHIEVILHGDNSLEVRDDGRGMPVDLHPEEGIPAIELILSRLHAGGKFSQDSYRFSGGLHGVGVSVVNALSERLVATVRRGGRIYEIEYRRGEKAADLRVTGSCARGDTGTGIRFWPEAAYFDSPEFDVGRLCHLLRAKAVLCAGLTLKFTDEARGVTEVWRYEGDLSDYLKARLEGAAFEPAVPFHKEAASEDWQAEFAAAWDFGSPAPLCAESYVNLIPTTDGGTHVNGFRSGLTLALREFCDLQNLLPRGLKLTPDDVWANCVYVLSVRMRDPQFSGQTKEKLSSRQIASQLEQVVRDHFSFYLNGSVEAGRALARKVIANARERESRSRTVERKKLVRGPQLPGKLVDCTSTDPAQGELFIVEGDSAGGSARQARDSAYQAILPLRGKILNTWEVSGQTALKSEEIRAISVAMGIEPGSEDLSSLRYGKICILADADSDGLHIGTLLCCLFVRHFKALVRAGHVYVACPPLYRLDCGKFKDYALDDAELEQKRRQYARRGFKAENIRIQRFKGLGEMNPEQLRETTLSPKSRRLMRLTLESGLEEETAGLLDLLLAKKRVEDRRQWLEENGDKAELMD